MLLLYYFRTVHNDFFVKFCNLENGTRNICYEMTAMFLQELKIRRVINTISFLFAAEI